ncbi:cytochrome C biogenesis protein CcdA, partial [Candidatus Woesearchaeota archaeon]|nr:cytochrome C biogenesis protein CcdA [Candidatus Woesearchaeota archaeon]
GLIFALLGMTSTLIGSLLRNNSLTISRFLGLIVIIFGIFVIFGKGFSGIRIKQKAPNKIFGSFLFGITFGIGWTPCVGPILASLFIIASQSATAFAGGIMLFLYALGLAIPLIVLSLFFDKLDQNSRFWKFLQGKEWKLKLFNKEIMLHSTSLISGGLLIVIGLLMSMGYLYAFNKFVRTTNFQRWIFGLEEKLLGLF